MRLATANIAELAAVIMPTALATTDGTVIVRDFTLLLKDRYDTLADGQFLAGGKKRDVQAIADSVQVIAKDADATANYSSLEIGIS